MKSWSTPIIEQLPLSDTKQIRTPALSPFHYLPTNAIDQLSGISGLSGESGPSGD